MSSFLFLHFCDDALRLLGLYFSAFHSFRTFLRWLFTAAVQTSTGAPHGFNRAGVGLRWCCFPTLPKKRKQGFTGRVVVLCSKTSLPLPLKGEGLDIVCLVCQVFHPEKPGAFPQEKTDTSYPRASLGSCPWQLLLTTAPHGSNRACSGLRWCRSPTCPPKSHTGSHRAEFWFSLQNELTPPPKGGGAGFCSILGCSSLLDSSTTASHGSNGAGLGSCRCPTPLPGSQICTQGRTGPSLVFVPACWRFSGGSPPFRQSRIRTQAEEKNTSAPLF